MIERLRPYTPLLIYLGLLGTILIAAYVTRNNLLYWLAAMLTAGLAISLLISWRMMRVIRVRRLDPEHGEVGEPLLVRYEVTNRSRWLPVFDVHIVEENRGSVRSWGKLMPPASAWVMHVGPGETVHGEAVYWPRRRGQADFNALRAYTTFPFGIWRKKIRRSQSQHTYIYPQVYELRPDVLRRISPAGPLGMKVCTRTGAGEDYFGLREYKPGDSLRRVAWKRSAKLDELVCIERTMPSPPRLRIVLDLTRPTDQIVTTSNSLNENGAEFDRRGEEGRLGPQRRLEEQAISLAASVLAEASRREFEIGLTVLGFDVPDVPMRHSGWHLAKALAALASIGLDDARISTVDVRRFDEEQAGLVVITPDRVRSVLSRPDAWYLTATHLHELAAKAVGKITAGPTANGEKVPASPTAPHSEKAADLVQPKERMGAQA